MGSRSLKTKPRKDRAIVHLDENEAEDLVEIRFCSDSDAKEILYVAKSSRRMREGKEAKQQTPAEACTPNHKRVAELRSKSPAQTPTGRRSSLRLTRSGSRADLHIIPEDEELVEDSDEEIHVPLKPKELFPSEENEDANGMSTGPTFLSRKRKGQMLQKALDSTNKSSPSRNTTPSKCSEISSTPSTKTTPRSNKIARTVTQTPHAIRRNIKKNLVNMMNDEHDDSDWEEESESEISECSSDESDMTIDLRPVTPASGKRGRKPILESPRTPSRSSSRMKNKLVNTYKADDYFASHSSKTVATSDNTLSNLKNPRLNPETMHEVLNQLPEKHSEEIEQITTRHIQKFEHWKVLLHEGYNLLLHGLGSKKSLISDFHQKILQEENVVVVNGFFPSLTVKDILKSVAEIVLNTDNIPGDEVESCDMIIEAYDNGNELPLYLLINNIDGPMLHADKSQTILARLASVPDIHLVASIDHINAPLLFDLSLLCRYNFVWQDVTTMFPYTEETSYENSLLVQQSGGLALASLNSVYQSLTSNARSIFLILLEKQMGSDDPKYPGMAFRDLYRESRDGFLVSSDLALRTQLTEFLDHHLVRQKRGHDGSEMLFIPIPIATLKEFQSMRDE